MLFLTNVMQMRRTNMATSDGARAHQNVSVILYGALMCIIVFLINAVSLCY